MKISLKVAILMGAAGMLLPLFQSSRITMSFLSGYAAWFVFLIPFYLETSGRPVTTHIRRVAAAISALMTALPLASAFSGAIRLLRFPLGFDWWALIVMLPLLLQLGLDLSFFLTFALREAPMRAPITSVLSTSLAFWFTSTACLVNVGAWLMRDRLTEHPEMLRDIRRFEPVYLVSTALIVTFFLILRRECRSAKIDPITGGTLA